MDPVERKECLYSFEFLQAVEAQEDQTLGLVGLCEVLLDYWHEIVHAEGRPKSIQDQNDRSCLDAFYFQLFFDISEFQSQRVQQSLISLRFQLCNVSHSEFPLLQQAVLLRIVPLRHDLLHLDLVMIRPQGFHGRPDFKQQVIGATNQREVVVAQHHPLLVELSSVERRTEIIAFDSCILQLEVLQLHDRSFQGVEHPVPAQLVGRFLQSDQLQALMYREDVPSLHHVHQNARKLQPRRHTFLKNSLKFRILRPANILEPNQLPHTVPNHPILAYLFEFISYRPREVTQLLKWQLLDYILHQTIEKSVEMRMDQQGVRAELLDKLGEGLVVGQEAGEITQGLLLD